MTTQPWWWTHPRLSGSEAATSTSHLGGSGATARRLRISIGMRVRLNLFHWMIEWLNVFMKQTNQATMKILALNLWRTIPDGMTAHVWIYELLSAKKGVRFSLLGLELILNHIIIFSDQKWGRSYYCGTNTSNTWAGIIRDAQIVICSGFRCKIIRIFHFCN